MRVQMVDLVEEPGSARVTLLQTFERENEAKPVCIASQILRLATR